MSVRVMTWVFDNSVSEGTDRLVLLAIADRANDDGTDAWPSLGWIAKKANVSERTVRRSIRNLESMGELRTRVRAGGPLNMREDLRPNLYTVVMGTTGHTCPLVGERPDIQGQTTGQMGPNDRTLLSGDTSIKHPETSAPDVALSEPSGRMDPAVRELGMAKIKELRGAS